jgi:hypothetical protein
VLPGGPVIPVVLQAFLQTLDGTECATGGTTERLPICAAGLGEDPLLHPSHRTSQRSHLSHLAVPPAFTRILWSTTGTAVPPKELFI